ncbi:magnesium transporter CorA family protein [Cognatiluteimonas profundi]|uniref:magnesium transporter CorA family protein n=1 Tax=Cognatiluteimonas profundi TaxID=2594501 RepID=UPI001E647D60|nr:CorA family divalent cation transporter [Lysobacter profundi]
MDTGLQPVTAAPPAGGAGWLRVTLYDADGADRTLDADAIDVASLSERQLLWIDVDIGDAESIDDTTVARWSNLAQRLDLGADGAQLLRELNGSARLQNFGEWFLVQVIAAEHSGGLKFRGRRLAIICGDNRVVSIHRGPVDFIERLRERERAQTRIGSLSAEGFTASLLDWMVESYLHAVSDFEAAVDRLEVTVLARAVNPDSLPELARLRRGASRLRRMLAPHRHVFGALARPDFRPDESGIADRQFRALEQRFERAMDAVENTRELVVGSFELFTTRIAQRTNDTMRTLTFATVLLGSLAMIAGALGMNFKAGFFDTADVGFWTAIGAMASIVLVAVGIGRWRRWF